MPFLKFYLPLGLNLGIIYPILHHHRNKKVKSQLYHNVPKAVVNKALNLVVIIIIVLILPNAGRW